MTRNQIIALAVGDEIESDRVAGTITEIDRDRNLVKIAFEDCGRVPVSYLIDGGMLQSAALTRKKSTAFPVNKGGDMPDVGTHPADEWISSLYTGSPGADTRTKLRRGYDAGFRVGHDVGLRRGLRELSQEASLENAQENGR